jgi:hybrid cluster-associated redox disulfide protein
MVKKKSKIKKKEKITADMDLAKVIQKYPKTVHVFFRYGMGCIGCPIAMTETIEQGAIAHGLNVKKLLADLNRVVK